MPHLLPATERFLCALTTPAVCWSVQTPRSRSREMTTPLPGSVLNCLRCHSARSASATFPADVLGITHERHNHRIARSLTGRINPGLSVERSTRIEDHFTGRRTASPLDESPSRECVGISFPSASASRRVDGDARCHPSRPKDYQRRRRGRHESVETARVTGVQFAFNSARSAAVFLHPLAVSIVQLIITDNETIDG